MRKAHKSTFHSISSARNVISGANKNCANKFCAVCNQWLQQADGLLFFYKIFTYKIFTLLRKVRWSGAA